MLKLTPTKYHWNAKSEAYWWSTEPGQTSGGQTFNTLYEAVEFVTLRLKPTETTAVQIFPDRGEPLHGQDIKDAWAAVGPPLVSAKRPVAFRRAELR